MQLCSSNSFNAAGDVLFSALRHVVTRPLQAATVVLFFTALPSIQATQEAIDSSYSFKNYQRWLDQHKCLPLFDAIAERTIPCSLQSRIEKVAFEGLPLDPFILQNSPTWVNDGWMKCILAADKKIAEDGHKYGAYELWYYRAEMLHARTQVREILGESSLNEAASSYSTAGYWLHDASHDWSMERDGLRAGQLRRLLDIQDRLTRLQGLVCEKSDEVAKAQEMLLWLKEEKYFDYTSAIDSLNLAFLSYKNGDCPQVKKIVQVMQKLAEHEIINLDQYVEMTGVGEEEDSKFFRMSMGPFSAITQEVASGNALTVRSALLLLQDHMS